MGCPDSHHHGALIRIPARDKAAADASKDSPTPSRQARPGEERAPAAPAAATLPGLQRSVGNAAVTRMLAAGHGAGPGHEDAPVRRAAARRPLRQEMEDRLGADFSDVRVHSDPLAQRSAAEIGARAYTSGSHVVVTDGGKDKHTLPCFLKVEDSPFRETRFGGDEPARIQIPLTRSPLMTQGRLMLGDFAQREYPTVRAKPEDPSQTEGKPGTREDTTLTGAREVVEIRPSLLLSQLLPYGPEFSVLGLLGRERTTEGRTSDRSP